MKLEAEIKRIEAQTKTKFDKWQKDILRHEGNLAIRTGRQCGKSEVVSEKAKMFALNNPGTTTLVVAASQRQSSLLFEKIKAKIELEHRPLVDKAIEEHIKKTGKEPDREERRRFEWDYGLISELPTQTRIRLNNGSVIYCLPTGKTGTFIRGYTIDLLIADEAAFIPEMVWLAIMPMIAVSRKSRGWGWIILLSTPFGKGGFFYNSCLDDDFKQIHVSSEDCPRISKKFLAKEKKRLSKQEYAQEYLALFIDDFSQLFSTSLIKERMTFYTWDRIKDYDKSNSYYLGVDFARFGGDENAFVIAEMSHKTKNVKIVKIITTDRKSITDSVGRILDLHEKYNFKRIFVDDAGVGGGATDMLQDTKGLKRKVIPLNNANKSVDKRAHKGKILKEDLYSNAIVMLENKKCELINHLALMRSLKSVTYEYTKDKNLRIYGNYTHIAEAMVRACWCVKDKGLNLFLA